MESIDTEIASRIRRDIILGAYEPGERLSEAQFCETHKVSRTPVRLALRLLEREGIVRRGEGRGYLIQSPTVEDVLQAVEVRGHLESLAARLMAQNPNRHDFLPDMDAAIKSGGRAIEKLVEIGAQDSSVLKEVHATNKLFHGSILAGCGNDYVAYTCEQFSHLPMLAVGSMVFDRSVDDTPERFERGLFRMRLGIAQHMVIFEAIERGDPIRAEGMMREHSRTMVEYLQIFEKQGDDVTVADLIAFSAAEPSAVAAQ